MRKGLRYIVCLVVVTTASLLMPGCKSQYVAGTARDSVRVEVRHDSVFVFRHDSIFRDRWRSGDTVYVTVEKWQTRWKDKTVQVHDTITVNSTETVVKVEQKKGFVYGCGWVLIVLVILFALWSVAKLVLRFYGVKL